MTPTVGRIVHVYVRNEPYRRDEKKIGPFAAIVTEVHQGSVVSLEVFWPASVDDERREQRFIPYDEDPNSDHVYRWVWPPRESAS